MVCGQADETNMKTFADSDLRPSSGMPTAMLSYRTDPKLGNFPENEKEAAADLECHAS